MCGITGVYLKYPNAIPADQLDDFVDSLLIGIEPRGTHATGLCAMPFGGTGTVLTKNDKRALQFVEERHPLPANTRIVLGHTRFATQGRPQENVNNHPVVYGTCFAVHNGHIWNDDEVFAKYDMTRLGEVDSEAIPAVFSKLGIDNAVFALEELSGGLAVAVADPVNNPDELLLAKGMQSPLIVLETDKMFVFSSEAKAIVNAWGGVIGTPPAEDKFRSLGEGEILRIKNGVTQDEVFDPPYYASTARTQHLLRSTQGSTYSGGYRYSSSWDTSAKDDWFECSCCDGIFDRDEMSFVGALYAICNECNVVSPNLSSQVKKEDEENSRLCGYCNFEGSDDTEGERIQGVWYCFECVGDPTKDDNPSCEIIPITGKVNLKRHLFLLERTSEATNYPPDFVDWLLFKAPMYLPDKDGWLADLRQEFDTIFGEEEDLLNDLEKAGTNLEEYMAMNRIYDYEVEGV